jgi:hypothetical protein
MAGLLDELAAGTSSGPAYPQIKMKNARFRIVDGENDQILKTTEITVALLRAKEKPERRFYLKPYVEGEEQAPDCKSSNGIVPDADSVDKQNSCCEGCQHNAWGTGKKADGTPSDGKACQERKLIVVAPVDQDGVVTEKAFGLSIPPTSLTPYNKYLSQLKLHGVKIPGIVITSIGFADANHPMLTFEYAGMLKPAEAAKAVKLMMSTEVASIISVSAPAPAEPTPEPATPPVEEKPVEPTPPPVEEKKKRGPKPKAQTSAFGETTASEPETKEVDDTPDDDAAAVAKALGIPFA